MDVPDLRASDADRERVLQELREDVAVGRLTLQEFSDRAERALGATTTAELEELRRDLPATAPGHHPRRRATRLTGVVFGRTERTGRLRLPRFGFAVVLGGDLDLDLRRAELSGPLATVTAFVVLGNVDFYVPEGVEVDLGGLAVFGRRREWGSELPMRPGAPLLRIRVFSLVGTSDVWRAPARWAERTFRDVINGLRRGEHRELPPGA